MDELLISLASLTVRPGESLFASAFFYSSSTPVTADSVLYRIVDVATGTVIRDWSAAVPGFTSTSVYVTGDDVELLDTSHLKEFRRVEFSATKGATTVTNSAIYAITNLGFQSIVVSLDCQIEPDLEHYLPLPSSRISRVVELDNWNP